LNRTARRAALLLPFAALLAGCEMETAGMPPDTYPPEVLAALPSGVPPGIVFLGADGCYAFAVEVTVPQRGYALRDARGNPICIAQPAAADAAAQPLT